MTRILSAALTALLLPAAAFAQTAPAPAAAPAPAPAAAVVPAEDPRFTVPSTVSPEAAALLRPGLAAQKASRPVREKLALDFKALRASVSVDLDKRAADAAKAMNVTYTEETLGGTPVLRVLPANAAKDGRILIYVHGGGWIGGSAKGTLRSAALYANATGLPVVSVDYGLSPEHDFKEITAQVIAAYRALLAQGHKPQQIGMFGDSAGGSIVPGSVLRMRDEGVPLPAALVLESPSFDLKMDGDSFTTLAAYDPVLDMPDWLHAVALAYAGSEAGLTNPWASPIHGNYSKPFPATLIQGGTREILLSDFVRGYQKIRAGGHEAVLDLYEGMPHVFMGLLPNTPEGKQAIGTGRDFFLQRLKKN